MNAAIYFLPYAQAAAQVGTAVVQQLGESVSAAGASFAEMLAGSRQDEDEKKIEEGVKDPGDATAMLALIDQIQSRLQATLQSMGLELDGELTLSIDDNGRVSIAGDSDSAAVLEQLINSDPGLQAKMGALKRAAQQSGAADLMEAKLRYKAGQVQLEAQEPEPAAEEQLAAAS